ncbi:diguanylate cyclase (GGDEF)-like protein [Kineothrix alysoides]|uniref:Diguanylate cyclase (GGDEF)-like protein n=1 Tax=Kineothrix alysoides TaxID=1469948 RepID=A0A4R1R0Z7_9FIRM|nr:GGDEF domain-containing protein [Kineothrix alysoides]TCL58985.1 diguanylate cyclase (GGDEF)-like protein [Kineothrix alysoides]
MIHTDSESTLTSKPSDSPIVRNSIPVRMLIACVFSCILGIVLMAVTAHYLVMSVFICILACIFITTPLSVKGRISIEAACLAPMLILCFVYTPISWFTFDGLLGCTPYLSILFLTIITLTYYRKIQIFVLSSYTLLILGLTIHWLVSWTGEGDKIQIINILAAYILTAILIVSIVETVKRKNLKINKLIEDISIHDELTGLLNRRAIEQIIVKQESLFKTEGVEYATVMIDVDDFKNINDNYGHHLGDLALKNVAECIRKSISSTDYVFRFGGDEFLIVLSGVDKVKAYQVCTDIQKELHEKQGDELLITVSAGYSLRSESLNIAELLKLADRRMYQAKKR